MTSQIKEKIRKCKICCQYQRARVEPLLLSSVPELPWQKVGTDLFGWKRSTYLLVIDYYSRFIEVAELSSVKSESVILGLKKIFARHGIPQLFISSNGPQYPSFSFAQFAKSYGFQHCTSSSGYSQANGEEAEKAV